MSLLSSILSNEKGNRGEQNPLTSHCHRVLLSWICLVHPALWTGFMINTLWKLSDNLLGRWENTFFILFLKPPCFVCHSGGSWFISPCLPNLQVLIFLRIFIIFSLVYSYTLQSQSHLEDFFGFNFQTLPVLPVDFVLSTRCIFSWCELQVPHTSWPKLSQ